MDVGRPIPSSWCGELCLACGHTDPDQAIPHPECDQLNFDFSDGTRHVISITPMLRPRQRGRYLAKIESSLQPTGRQLAPLPEDIQLPAVEWSQHGRCCFSTQPRVEDKTAAQPFPPGLHPILILRRLLLRDKVLGGDSSLDGASSFFKASAGASHCLRRHIGRASYR